MIVIKTYLKESKIDKGGIGLYADEPVKKGQTVIKMTTPGLDIELNQKEFEKLSKEEQTVILHYGFKNKFSDKYHLNFDDARFINHSKDGNLVLNKETLEVEAKRDISVGEELTQDYSDFENLREELNGVE